MFVVYFVNYMLYIRAHYTSNFDRVVIWDKSLKDLKSQALIWVKFKFWIISLK